MKINGMHHGIQRWALCSPHSSLTYDNLFYNIYVVPICYMQSPRIITNGIILTVSSVQGA